MCFDVVKECSAAIWAHFFSISILQARACDKYLPSTTCIVHHSFARAFTCVVSF